MSDVVQRLRAYPLVPRHLRREAADCIETLLGEKARLRTEGAALALKLGAQIELLQKALREITEVPALRPSGPTDMQAIARRALEREA